MTDEHLMTGDWAQESEDYDFLSALPPVPMDNDAWKAFQRPADIDIDWHRTENQGPIGSCQGHSLSS